MIKQDLWLSHVQLSEFDYTTYNDMNAVMVWIALRVVLTLSDTDIDEKKLR